MKMKRFLIVLLALCCLVGSAMAENRVIDEAGLLSAQEKETLEQTIAQIQEKHQMDVVVLLVDSIGSKQPRDYAADYYDYGGYGLGSSKDGVLFLLSMGTRDYFTLLTGRAIPVFTNARQALLHEEMAPYLSDGEYFTALEKYLHRVDVIMGLGVPADGYGESVYTPDERAGKLFPFVLIAALVVSLITAFSLKGQLKTVRRKNEAMSYVRDGSFHLTRSQDIYLYTTTQRHKIETDTDHHSSGGGGGTSTFSGSSGTTHGGSGGKF